MEENVQPVSTRSIGIKWGLISALIGLAIFIVVAALGYNPFSNTQNFIGLVISVVLLVLAHKNFKESGDGFMSYGQGVAIGFWSALVSTAISMLVVYLYIEFIDYTPMQTMFEEQAASMERSGQSQQSIDIAMEWTRKLFWPIGIFFGIFFGVLAAVIVSIFTQKKRPEQVF